jgi:hypothetical protein
MTLYVVTMEATVSVTVEAENEEEAGEKARCAFRWTDVEIDDVIEIFEAD